MGHEPILGGWSKVKDFYILNWLSRHGCLYLSQVDVLHFDMVSKVGSMDTYSPQSSYFWLSDYCIDDITFNYMPSLCALIIVHNIHDL